MRTTFSMVTLCAAALLAWQDPRAPQQPVTQQPVNQEPVAPAVVEPDAATTKPTAKEPVAAPRRHRYEGVYRLRDVMVDGSPATDQKRGYLAITGRHLFLVVAADGPDPEQPLVSAGVRRWKEELGGMRTTVELDFFHDHAGELHFVPPGLPEVRGIELSRGGLRLRKDATTWMDFERIE